MKITTVGIDMLNTTFSMHGIDEHGKAVMKRTVSRGKVLEVMAVIGPCLVGLKACRVPATERASWDGSGTSSGPVHRAA